MKNKTILIYVVVIFVIAGCNSAPASEEINDNERMIENELAESSDATVTIITLPATETSSPTQTPIPPSNTPSPTVTPSSTSTNTPTPSPTPTLTPTSTETPLPTMTSTAIIVPTAVPTIPPTPNVPSFPNTEIAPFTEDAFAYQVGRLRDTLTEFDSMYKMISFGNQGNCIIYGGIHKNWTEHLPVFEDVPEKYNDLYVEYRSIIYQAVTLSQEIADVCSRGGGHVSDETDVAIRSFLDWAKPRSEQMVVEFAQLR